VKKILISLVTGGSVLAAAVFATNAYFNDVETSSGNTFTAGKVDLKISSQCSYNGAVSGQCGTWQSDDLKNVTSSKFFNFSDIKPGDWGENTIGFKVLTNDAWMCANLNATTHEKLAEYLNVFWWVDNGNNVYEQGEKVLYGGPQPLATYLAIKNPLPMTFADSLLNWEGLTPGTPIPGNTDKYLGIAWCFGNMTATGSGDTGFTCDGSGSNNDAQGTHVVADLSFSAEQFRNNPGFKCPEHQ
jgi:predicted ribosomally synthesized peptide with SipW-like signal peptide